MEGSRVSDGRLYTYSAAGATAATAESRCSAAGGSLASINSAAENSVVFGMNTDGTVARWIGGARNGGPSITDFFWNDGSSTTYNNFRSGASGGSSDCLTMGGPSGTLPLAGWELASCSSTLPYVCEQPGELCVGGDRLVVVSGRVSAEFPLPPQARSTPEYLCHSPFPPPPPTPFLPSPKVTCPGTIVGLPDNVAALCSNTMVGAECTATCNIGFSGEDSVYTCQPDGTFSGTAPTCTQIDCGPAPSGLGSNVVANCNQGTIFGSTCVTECATGYQPATSGGSYVCGLDGEWSTRAPLTCAPVQCALPIPGLDANAEPTDCSASAEFGAPACNIECADGFSGSGSYTCGADGAWVGDLTCGPISCDTTELDDLANTLRLCGDNILFGDSCTVECAPGYDGGSADFSCDGDNILTGSLTCTPKDCGPDLGLGPNTEFMCTETTFDSSCTVACASGYQVADGGGVPSDPFSGQAPSETTFDLRCDEDGNWVGQETCERISCGALADILDESLTVGAAGCASTLFEDSCPVVCADGYERQSGITSFTCTASGEWVGDLVCTRVRCPSSVPGLDSSIDASCGSDPAFGDQCTVTCLPGYDGTSETFACDASGTWVSTSSPLLCTPKDCGTAIPSLDPNASADCSVVDTRFGEDNCIATCNAAGGFAPVSGDGNYTCSEDGVWVGELTCAEVSCPAEVPGLSNAVSSCTAGTAFGDSCTAQCQLGFDDVSAAGGKFTCGIDGAWSGSIDCQPVNCGPLIDALPLNAVAFCRNNTRYKGTECVASCADGFDVDGSPYFVCTPYGTWQGGCGFQCVPSGSAPTTVTNSADCLADFELTYEGKGSINDPTSFRFSEALNAESQLADLDLTALPLASANAQCARACATDLACAGYFLRQFGTGGQCLLLSALGTSPRRTTSVSFSYTKRTSFLATPSPTTSPTLAPTDSPTTAPSLAPTPQPTTGPTDAPTTSPTFAPTGTPTTAPTAGPTSSPTPSPSIAITGSGVCSADPGFCVSLDATCGQTLGGDWDETMALEINNYLTQLGFEIERPTFSSEANKCALTATCALCRGSTPPSYCNDRVVASGSALGTLAFEDRLGMLCDLMAFSLGLEVTTASPTRIPTLAPTPSPTGSPTSAPTGVPTLQPTGAPTDAPTDVPAFVTYTLTATGALSAGGARGLRFSTTNNPAFILQTFRAARPADCETVCNSNAACLGFYFFTATNGWCKTLSNLGSLVATSDVSTSWTKTVSRTPVPTAAPTTASPTTATSSFVTYSLVYSSTAAGGGTRFSTGVGRTAELMLFQAGSPEGCESACTALPACVGFYHFVATNGWCKLLSNLGVGVSTSTDSTSWAKTFSATAHPTVSPTASPTRGEILSADGYELRYKGATLASPVGQRFSTAKSDFAELDFFQTDSIDACKAACNSNAACLGFYFFSAARSWCKTLNNLGVAVSTTDVSTSWVKLGGRRRRGWEEGAEGEQVVGLAEKAAALMPEVPGFQLDFVSDRVEGTRYAAAFKADAQLWAEPMEMHTQNEDSAEVASFRMLCLQRCLAAPECAGIYLSYPTRASVTCRALKHLGGQADTNLAGESWRRTV